MRSREERYWGPAIRKSYPLRRVNHSKHAAQMLVRSSLTSHYDEFPRAHIVHAATINISYINSKATGSARSSHLNLLRPRTRRPTESEGERTGKEVDQFPLASFEWIKKLPVRALPGLLAVICARTRVIYKLITGRAIFVLVSPPPRFMARIFSPLLSSKRRRTA